MRESFNRKYKKVLEILPDVAECINGKLILVGGTALALFHLKHRVSVDLDFVPVLSDQNNPTYEKKIKQELKGCLSKKGYKTSTGAFENQFIIQFEDTSIKIEIFEPDHKPKFKEHIFAGVAVNVATLEDILIMKEQAYKCRLEARDLFDIFCILKSKNQGSDLVKELVSKTGVPKNIQDIDNMSINSQDVILFKKVLSDAS